MDPINPYQAPRADSRAPLVPESTNGVSRSGRLLVVGHDAVLPDRCVKCNAPAAGYKHCVKMFWHAPLLYLVLLLSVPLYVVLALCFRNKLVVNVGLCPEHVQKRRMALLCVLLGLPLGVVLVVLSALVDTTYLSMLVIIPALVSALIYFAVKSRIVRAQKITKQFAWVEGVCPDYLASLSEQGELIEPGRQAAA